MIRRMPRNINHKKSKRRSTDLAVPFAPHLLHSKSARIATSMPGLDSANTFFGGTSEKNGQNMSERNFRIRIKDDPTETDGPTNRDQHVSA